MDPLPKFFFYHFCLCAIQKVLLNENIYFLLFFLRRHQELQFFNAPQMVEFSPRFKASLYQFLAWPFQTQPGHDGGIHKAFPQQFWFPQNTEFVWIITDYLKGLLDGCPIWA